MSFVPDSDPDEPLLPAGQALPAGALRVPAARPEFRAALERRTAALVRRGAVRRRAARLGLFALVYAAGLLTAICLRTGAVQQPQAPTVAVGPPLEAPPATVAEPPVAAVPVLPRPPSPVALDERRLTPAQLRARVEGAPRAEQIRLLRLAGDRYLYDYDDINSALHCYRQVLELEPPDREQPFGPEDSWLLAELKNARVLQEGRQRRPGA